MLWMKWKMVADSLRGRRRRIPCSLWFLMLFAAGGLVLFIHQRDLSEMVLQQGPGMRLGSTPRQSRETLSTQDRERSKSDSYQAADGVLSSPIPPMQFPHFEENRPPATTGSQEKDISSPHVSKRQRKLLKTSPLINHTNNNVTLSFSSPSTTSPTVSTSSPVLTPFSSNTVEARQQLIKDICAKYKSSISKTITRHHVRHLFVEDKHKLLYCQVPKAGCSNWKRTLILLAGKASDAESLKHDTVHGGLYLKTLDSFEHHEIMDRLETYTKVIFVREPMERMVSAFRDKFENPNKYYHSLFGKQIISKYRNNPSSAALETGDGVTFHEFVKYLVDVHKPVGMDIHWNQVDQLCNLCLINYDFIGRFENMEEESSFLLQLIGAPPNISVPTFKDRNPKDIRTSLDITQKYFSPVSLLERQRVYDFYYMDYLMFNYSKPFKDLY